MNNWTAASNLSLKSEKELKETVKRFMKEAGSDVQKLRDKLTGAQFKNIEISHKLDGTPWVVTATASGKKILVIN